MTDLEKQFGDFDGKNPFVWSLFVEFTEQLVERGFRHYSADAVLHRIRWETSVGTREAGSAAGRLLKLNNNYAAYYARKYHRISEATDGFFHTRRVRGILGQVQMPWA